jgi:hypothetical protein
VNHAILVKKQIGVQFVAHLRSLSIVAAISIALASSFFAVSGTVFADTTPVVQAPPVVNGIVQISTAGQLEYVDQHQTARISSTSSLVYLNASIELMNNIDLNGYQWKPFGNALYMYRGQFNGQGYKISNFIINGTTEGVGFFGVTYIGTSITNLGVEGSVTGNYDSVGLLVGSSSSAIKDCYSEGSVTGKSYYDGGLVGSNGGIITDSYSTASVSGLNQVGGLVGLTQREVNGDYATGTVTSTYSHDIGGLVGNYNMGSISNSYYDQTTTGQKEGIGNPNFGGATPLSDTAMKLASSYTSTPSWDFTKTWGIDPSINNGYPYLRSMINSYNNSGNLAGNLPEVPVAGVLPVIGLFAIGSLVYGRQRKMNKRSFSR